MIVEILGAKMLSPYVGTSHFVWTAQIAVTLVALACGYYAGGRLVDRSLRMGRLYAGILVAGVYLALTVAITEPVAYACFGIGPGGRVVVGFDVLVLRSAGSAGDGVSLFRESVDGVRERRGR